VVYIVYWMCGCPLASVCRDVWGLASCACLLYVWGLASCACILYVWGLVSRACILYVWGLASCLGRCRMLSRDLGSTCIRYLCPPSVPPALSAPRLCLFGFMQVDPVKRRLVVNISLSAGSKYIVYCLIAVAAPYPLNPKP